MLLQVNDREFATILAALRLWHGRGPEHRHQYEIATDGGYLNCERLNCEG